MTQIYDNAAYEPDSNKKNDRKIENETKIDPKEQKPKKKKIPSVSFIKLFRYASGLDTLMILIGSLGAIGSGALQPVMLLFFTNIIDTFTNYERCNRFNKSIILENCTNFINITLTKELEMDTIYLAGLGVLATLLGYIQVAFWLIPAEKQTRIMRKKLFAAILRQEVGWFDTYKSGELTNRLTDDITKVKDGIGDKFAQAIASFSTFLVGIVLGFIRGWELTLVILSLSPILFALSFIFTKIAESLTKNELKSYANAGSVAEEVFSSIRTVFAFNGGEKVHKRYEDKLKEARKSGIKKGIITGILFGVIFLVVNCSYALGFWFGWYSGYSSGQITLVFFCIISGVFSLGNAAPFVTTLATASGAAYEVFLIIDRKPIIDSESESGEKPDKLESASIQFNSIKFEYPSRPDITVLNDISFKIKSGTTVALVGSSGCGKSTCMQLLQRFYNASNGNILVGNKNIMDYNLNWLRDQIGVVNQEPILFGTTIAENIRYGKENVDMNEIVKAARNANAHDFIVNLPQKYETLVGERGSQLSGGQKQRIAIARALVRNPKILLLDEATSALDNESESIVQAALDKARLGRTTIIVAHRLSTIKNADLIYCLDKGQIVEVGTHNQLMKLGGIYKSLVINQTGGQTDANPEDDDEIAKNRTKSIDNENYDEKEEKKTVADSDSVPKKKINPSILRAFKLNAPEWPFILVGCISCIINGASNPLFSYIFTNILALFAKPQSEQEKDIILYCSLFVGFGLVQFFSNFLQSAMFAISGERLTMRLRSTCFKTMLKQDLEFYDKPENNVGTLTTRLAVEAASVQGATGAKVGNILMNFANLGIGIILAFVNSWAITLLIAAFIPVMILSGILQTKLLTGFAGKDKKSLEDAGKITSETISNIKTVSILNKQKFFSNAYNEKIDAPYKAAVKSANVYGFMLGFTNSVIYYAIASAFQLGAHIIDNALFILTFERIMIVFSSVIFGAAAVGQASSLLPDYTKAKVAIANIFDLFDRIPSIDNWESTKGIIPKQEIIPKIELNNLEFAYPNRPAIKVLDNLSFTINPGQKVALVGSSGCGKSTVTQLLERFYNPIEGKIKIGSFELKDLNLKWLRSQISIVSQEPILFDATIAENIAYGDNSRVISMDEIQNVAKLANIHDFISNLPLGYETNVGSKGTQLSGGQKQRISIARALVRNPKVLLLDEATSALDTESEKVVQEALDKAQEGRTCIIIAHRLSTIKNCDCIFVFKNGQILEYGTNDELMDLSGFYAKLNNKKETKNTEKKKK